MNEVVSWRSKMSENVFCKYCKRKLDLEKERSLGYHKNCEEEMDNYSEFGFMVKSDQNILEKIKSILNLPWMYIFDTYIEFSDYEIYDEEGNDLQLDPRIRTSNVIISLEQKHYENDKVLKEVKNIIWKNINFTMIKQIWEVTKHTRIGTPKFFTSIYKDDLEFILKLRDIFVFPKLQFINNVLMINPNNLVSYLQANKEEFINDKDIVKVYLTAVETEKRVLSVDFTQNIARRIRKIPNFFTLLGTNLYLILDKPEQKILKDLSAVLTKTSLEFKSFFNYEYNRIVFNTYEKQSDEQINSNKEEKLIFSLDFYLVDKNEVKKVEKLKIQFGNQDLFEIVFSLDWQNLDITTMVIQEKTLRLAQTLINKIDTVKSLKSLYLYVDTKTTKGNYELDFKKHQNSILERFTFTSTKYCKIVNFDVFKQIKKISLVNGTINNFTLNHPIEKVELSGKSDSFDFLVELPDKVINLTIDSSILSKIAINRDMNIKKLSLAMNNEINTKLPEKDLEILLTLIKNTNHLEHLRFIGNCSDVKKILENINGINSLSIKNPNSFQEKPTGDEKGIKGVENFTLEGPWQIGIPSFIGNLKNLRTVVIDFECFYDVGAGLKDIHELHVFKQLPVLETIFVASKDFEGWNTAFKKIKLQVKIEPITSKFE